MSMYSLSRQDVIEVAADILECSTERIRVRCRMCKKGGKIERRPERICFACSIPNPYAKANGSADSGYTLLQQYNDSRFSLNGSGVWIPDKQYFFFDYCKAAPDAFVYLEFERF